MNTTPSPDRRPVSSPHRPPSYVSQTDAVPASPNKVHVGRPKAFLPLHRTGSEQDEAISDSRMGRPVSRRLSDFAVPQLLPRSSGRPESISPKRPQGARTESSQSYNRSSSPDTSIRMPLMSEKNNWVDESPYEVPHIGFSVKAYSVLSDDDTDSHSLAPTTTNSSDHEQEKLEYGPVPAQPQPRRGHKKKTIEVVNLTAGNLIIEREIPEKLRGLLGRHDLTEFTHVRYSAITCDPDEFMHEGFFLRQHASSRETEILVVMTMYNEDETLFTRTLHGVIKNIAHLTSRTRSRTWGVDSWQKIVVLIIADGRKNINPRVLDVLTALGVYQDGLAQSKVNGSSVQAHLYEYTTQYSMTPDLQFRGADKNIPPIQISFLLKEQNQKKLNSHRWALNGLAPNLQPNICVLLDVGTRPGSDSIYKLWKAFDMDSRIAGAAGEIRILAGRAWSALLNPLVASQNFEYKMSNLLDKPCESVFGYIGVLPGAFSAYRYRALVGDVIGVGPLEKYFKGEKIDLEADGQKFWRVWRAKLINAVFQKNMYLAEDRILAFELIAKRDCDWLLKYVGDAYGETDCPNTVSEIIGQRRRWLNGATFASTYALWNFRRIWSTSHTTARKLALHIEFLYQAVQLLFTFFGLGNFYLIFFFIAQSFGQKFYWASYTFVFLRYLCIMVTSAQFILALGNRPRGAKALFLLCLVLYSVIMIYTLVCATYLGVSSVLTEVRQGGNILGDKQFTNLVLSAITTTGVYFVVSLLYLDIWHMFTSFVPYMLLLPFYVCTLTIFAFCNIHDLSWGTKEEDVTELDIVEAKVLKDDSNKVKVELYQGSDAEGAYEDALTNLRIRKAVPDRAQDVSKVQEDYFKEVRTVVVLCWLISNLVLMMGVSEYYSGSTGSNIYLSVVMYSVVLMTAFRFVGSLTYLVLTTVQKIIGRKSAQVRTSALTVKAETKRFLNWGKRSQVSSL